MIGQEYYEPRKPRKIASEDDALIALLYAENLTQPSIHFAQTGIQGGHCGGSEPRYAEIAIISSSERLETTFFISATAVPALDPF
jgi:hypothetical protein